MVLLTENASHRGKMDLENIGTLGALSHHQDRQESVTGDSVFMHCRMTIFCTGSPWPLSLIINLAYCMQTLSVSPQHWCCQFPTHNLISHFQLIQDKKTSLVWWNMFACCSLKSSQTVPIETVLLHRRVWQYKGVPAAHISQLVEHLTEKPRAILMQFGSSCSN